MPDPRCSGSDHARLKKGRAPPRTSAPGICRSADRAGQASPDIHSGRPLGSGRTHHARCRSRRRSLLRRLHRLPCSLGASAPRELPGRGIHCCVARSGRAVLRADRKRLREQRASSGRGLTHWRTARVPRAGRRSRARWGGIATEACTPQSSCSRHSDWQRSVRTGTANPGRSRTACRRRARRKPAPPSARRAPAVVQKPRLQAAPLPECRWALGSSPAAPLSCTRQTGKRLLRRAQECRDLARFHDRLHCGVFQPPTSATKRSACGGPQLPGSYSNIGLGP